MNRREDLQQFFISANTSQDKHDFDFEKFTDEYLIRNPNAVKKNDLSHIVIVPLPSNHTDNIIIYESYDKGKWCIAAYGLIKEPFDTPQDALESILKERQ